MCQIDYADRASTLLKEVTRKARKEHQCFECRRDITKGEHYNYEVFVCDGHVSDVKTCTHCLKARDLLSDKCHGWVYGEIRNDLWEHVFMHLPWSIAAGRMVVGIDRKWRRFKSDKLMPIPAQMEAKDNDPA